ncbi:GL22344 [Drosophila persimilis]|uniref:GL22344 n=1 Tax=Drosophila persimilis TaxID=7234 RepID=B4GDW5_DROPE|nr:GL22344 [Drosophila persimilis]
MVVLETASALLGGPYAQGAPALKMVQKRYIGLHQWLGPIRSKELKEHILLTTVIAKGAGGLEEGLREGGERRRSAVYVPQKFMSRLFRDKKLAPDSASGDGRGVNSRRGEMVMGVVVEGHPSVC